jgi:hypothetical protein
MLDLDAYSRPSWHPDRMELGRIAWLVTTVSCLVAAAIVLVEGYRGYAAVAFAVAISAAINLF